MMYLQLKANPVSQFPLILRKEKFDTRPGIQEGLSDTFLCSIREASRGEASPWAWSGTLTKAWVWVWLRVSGGECLLYMRMRDCYCFQDNQEGHAA